MHLLVIASLLIGTVAPQGRAADYPTFSKDWAGEPFDPDPLDIVWRDEFDELRASVAGKGDGPWFSGVHAVLARGEKMARFPDPAFRIEAGVLRMSTRMDPVDSKRVESHLQTDDGRGKSVTFQNGYIEARMWMPRALGSHAGLWLLSREIGLGHVEADVVETYGAGDYAVHSSTHIWPIAPMKHQSESNYVKTRDIFEGYRLYGMLATNTEFRFFLDRKEIGRIARLPEQRVPLYILLSVLGNISQPVIEPAVMLVDYVRIYSLDRPNAPDELRAR